ncbi:pectate lyase family protein [Allosalinactinospora lopnorensis]|uniref:pectate lyase family protein n=1 Tax=Allosalinactinospora lopnorensis TaxID=1352348 RepID=UPI000623E7DB|nr:pectate lyase [Allosalinactinospora lopnorensis]
MRKTIGLGIAVAVPLTLLAATQVSANADELAPGDERLARAVLGDRDGWAAHGDGTTGGSAAEADQVHVVGTWEELREAVGPRGDDTPRIIAIDGALNAHVDADGDELGCSDYQDSEFDFDAYLDTYSPENWGMEEEPSGPLEEARVRSMRNQQEQIQLHLNSNTTLIGLGDDARVLGGNILIDGADNVIVRNIGFENAHDCWPQWDPTDGSEGNWNSEFDNMSVRRAENVWIDHNEFSDKGMPDSELPEYHGREYQVHDGLLDITHGADLVTVSYNDFSEHDKTMLIGSTDSPTYDVGELRVTLHHNRWENVLQRAPRVRWGQVHVYNNHYVIPDNPEGEKQFSYSWGVGYESQLYAENNYFDIENDADVPKVVRDWRGEEMQESGSLLNGRSPHHRVSMLEEYNAVADEQLGDTVGWEPTLHDRVHPTQSVPGRVGAHAGTGNL